MPRTISFKNVHAASSFQNALKHLANTLERRMETLRRASKLQLNYRSYHESTANLSRVSLPRPILATDRPTIAESTADASGAVEPYRACGAFPTRRSEGERTFSIAESLGGEDGPDIAIVRVDWDSPVQNNAASVEAPNHHSPEIELAREKGFSS